MVLAFSLIVAGIVAIVVASESFTNSLEYIGDKLNLSQAVIGSILAAIGTALPETILPIIAILFLNTNAEHIGIGAILGAPFMLSTLGFFMVGAGAIIRFFLKKGSLYIDIERKTAKRDLSFFLISYALAIVSTFFLSIKDAISALIVIIYIFYLYRTFKGRSQKLTFDGNLYLSKYIKLKETLILGWVELFIALLVIVFGSFIFVESLSKISEYFGFNQLIFSLLLSPIATELPEKINSLTWTLKSKDILAFGNISGAMVFQSTFPVSIGILLTNWTITPNAILSAYVTLFNIFLLLFVVYFFKKINGYFFLLNLCTYIFYISIII